MESLQSIIQEEFQLVYYGHFDYTTVDELTVHEREMIYSMLVNQKQEEKKAYEDAIAKSKQNKSNNNHRRR